MFQNSPLYLRKLIGGFQYLNNLIFPQLLHLYSSYIEIVFPVFSQKKCPQNNLFKNFLIFHSPPNHFPTPGNSLSCLSSIRSISALDNPARSRPRSRDNRCFSLRVLFFGFFTFLSLTIQTVAKRFHVFFFRQIRGTYGVIQKDAYWLFISVNQYFPIAFKVSPG